MKNHLVTAAITALLVSGSALADQHGDASQMTNDMENGIHTQAPDFNQLDTDKNGVISHNEAAASQSLSEKWSDVDENEDGQLSQAEFSAFEAADLRDRAKQHENAADEVEDRIDRAN